MPICRMAVLLLAVLALGSASIFRAEDPPATPTESRLSAGDTLEFAQQLVLLQQVQNQALRKKNEALAASMEARALDKQAEALSAKFEAFLAQRKPRPGCDEMPTLEGKWNCPAAPGVKKEPAEG